MPRERVPLLRDREDDLAGDLDAAVLREAFAVAPDERLAPVADDLARVEDDFLAALLERAVFDPEVDLGVPLERPEVERPLDEPEPLLRESSSPVHLPDMTRWAASATASAMVLAKVSLPSFGKPSGSICL